MVDCERAGINESFEVRKELVGALLPPKAIYGATRFVFQAKSVNCVFRMRKKMKGLVLISPPLSWSGTSWVWKF